MSKDKNKAIIGGIFGTERIMEMNEDGQWVETQKEEFHIRLYKHLWTSKAIRKLKGHRLGVLLTIAIHFDGKGESWPSLETIAEYLGIGRDTAGTAAKDLEKLGFIERIKRRLPNGKWANTRYRLKWNSDQSNHVEKSNTAHEGKSDMDESPKNQGFSDSSHVGFSETDFPRRIFRDGKSNNKDELSPKDDPSSKDDPSLKNNPSNNPSFPSVVENVVERDINKYKNAICEYFEVDFDMLHEYELSDKEIMELEELANEKGKDLIDCIYATYRHFADSEEEIESLYGSIKYAINTGWRKKIKAKPKGIKPVSPEQHGRSHRQPQPPVEFQPYNWLNPKQ